MQVNLRQFLRDPGRSGAFAQRHRRAAKTAAGQAGAEYTPELSLIHI